MQTYIVYKVYRDKSNILLYKNNLQNIYLSIQMNKWRISLDLVYRKMCHCDISR